MVTRSKQIQLHGSDARPLLIFVFFEKFVRLKPTHSSDRNMRLLVVATSLLLGAAIAAECATNTGRRAVAKASEESIVNKTPPAVVAPPRSTADITAILEKEKPDLARISKLTAEAEAVPPATLSGNQLAEFYYRRAQSALLVGRLDQSIVDAQAALKEGKKADYEPLRPHARILGTLLRKKREPARTQKSIAGAKSHRRENRWYAETFNQVVGRTALAREKHEAVKPWSESMRICRDDPIVRIRPTSFVSS
jgi:hypothetical protein